MQNKSTKITEQAGEIISSIGSHIADATSAVADVVAKEYNVVKKAVKKKLARKIFQYRFFHGSFERGCQSSPEVQY